ncbi:unnamed protein product [Vicia faba]|uniref:Disease resistance R13L4/SHOC-2-like LRR domain-containing protein n=1 Tax=Vicia faba TaxID=3906 RepID=A0AAV0YWP9_VICFA|nr:unnamed protein product [Vicia faba]
MKELHLLSQSNYRNITEVPNSIGNLLHPRYLNLSYTKIERLPSATCQLYNLQFLLVSGCKRLSELPEDIGKLDNLRHLDVSGSALREIAIQIAKLENLQTLSDIVVNKHNGGLKVREVGKFPHLQGKLSISQLQYVNDPFEASLANMTMKEQIDELALEWDCEDASQKSLSFLRSIKIWDCNELESFSPVGLATPNLIYFAVWKCEKLSSLPEAMHNLTALQEIEIDNQPNLRSFVINDWPISLKELTVGFVGEILWNADPTWEHLTCLSVLQINSDDTVNALMGPLLPASLVKETMHLWSKRYRH